MSTDRPLFAWRVVTRGFPDAAIVAAPGANRARAVALAAAIDAGYTVAWTDMAARRAPEYDGWVAACGEERGWNEAYARRCMAEGAAGETPGRADEG
jgi:hypothetical protein